MTEDLGNEALHEWNRLSRENVENAIVSSMYEASLGTSKSIDSFSTWLLVGTATVASFFLTNADKLLPFIKQAGFIGCGIFLCASCLFGLLSRIMALYCRVQTEAGAAIKTAVIAHMARYQTTEKEIKRCAAESNVMLETNIRIEKILSEFMAYQPCWTVWLARRTLQKYQGNPQIGYILPTKIMHWQGQFCFVQALLFFGFLVFGFIYVAIV